MSDEDVFPAIGAPFSFTSRGYRISTRFGAGERARALSRLKDNWDGHFAHAPREEVVERAATLLDALPAGMPYPEVSPSTEGGVILEWEQPGAEVLLIIGPTDIEVSVELDGVVTEGPLAAVESALVATLARVASGS